MTTNNTIREVEILHQLNRSKKPLTASQIVKGSGYYFEFKQAKSKLSALMKRLIAKGFITAGKEPVINSFGVANRWVYRITEAGVKALEAVE